MIDDEIRAVTCLVSCDTESGTGWLIGKNTIITARHCVIPGIAEGKSVEVFFRDSEDIAISVKIAAHSEEWDVSLLVLEKEFAGELLRINLDLPREGEAWRAFGFPGSKSDIGHWLRGEISQVLNEPKRKIDVDLSVEPATALRNEKGMSGAAVVCEGQVVGVLTKKFDGSVAALSLYKLKGFLSENNVTLPSVPISPSQPLLADRGAFLEVFSKAVYDRPGSYLFLEGAHGYGKSTFCENFKADEKKLINMGAYRLSDPESAMDANFRARPQVLFDWLTTAIAGRITGKAPRKEERSDIELIHQTTEYIEAFSRHCEKIGKQGMFFVDGLNEITSEALLVDLLNLLPAKLPSNITVVLTAPNFNNIKGMLVGKVKTTDVLELPPLSNSACYRHCEMALNLERRLPALVDRICKKAKGHPLYLRYLIEYANYQTLDDDLNDFPILSGSIEEYYHGLWAKLEQDGEAVNLLALMARLRWGIPLEYFVRALNQVEQAQFVPITSRIRHLMADGENTEIYHSSFAAFIVEQTKKIEAVAFSRLARFCREEPEVRYCTLNRIFHLTLAEDNSVFAECNQVWFDNVVSLGVEPDALIADVDAVVKSSAMEAPADEFFRLTLLAQRISFRYNTLFAQSARLIAEALIVLGRPNEAIQHVLRIKTLIVGVDDALEIAFLLHRHGNNMEALTLLGFVEQRIIESYHPPIELSQLLDCCCFHIKTDLRIGLVTDRSRMEQFHRIVDLARGACEEALGDDYDDVVTGCMQPVLSVATSHFLAFRDKYAGLSNLKAKFGEEANFSHILPSLCIALLGFEDAVEENHLPKHRCSLPKLFTDLAELVSAAEIKPQAADTVANTLIRFGAPSKVVELFGVKGGRQPPTPIQIRAQNGVDINQDDLQQRLCEWRVAAFLDDVFHGLSSGIIAGTGWIETLEHLVGALYSCDGIARRAMVDSNQKGLRSCHDRLKNQVIEPLRFSLELRARWTDSYAIPEKLLPGIYRQLTELLSDCFPEALPEWLDNLTADAEGQWGMYSEGFRDSAYQVLMQLTREDPSADLLPKLLALLHAWKNHVVRGVENRHELVPEILRMIPLLTHLGAREEAERMYTRLMSVSMGPTWYKEDQLGIMIEVLGSIAVSKEVGQRIPLIAGYLEKGSGEITFQRYVQQRKSDLLGEMARHGKFRGALAYFRRQCCGSTAELWMEAQHGPIDKLGAFKGNRFPGGALDDQAAILALVGNSGDVSWALRWALLEIFHCGNSRHLASYAVAYAEIANEVGATPELVRRLEIVANAETPTDERNAFASDFRSNLKQELHVAFAAVLAGLPPVEPAEPPEPRISGEIDEDDDGFFSPGTFGRQSSLREADKILIEAEKQLSLGNRIAAKVKAVEVLRTAQKGGWRIWGDLSDGARRAEEILIHGEAEAVGVIRYYAPLIAAERYVSKWEHAQHLIRKVGTLLNQTECPKVIDAVIDHVRLLVGDSPQEIEDFGFLADDEAEENPTIEFFRFIVWLCDHPQWLRRERSAAMLLWLVEQVPEVFLETATTAFSMDEGYGPDVLCGVLDGASNREPTALWDKVAGVLNLDKVTQELRHTSRMVVLERLASRAEKSGSFTAKSALNLIKASYIGIRGSGSSPQFPKWASQLAQEWRQIVHLLDTNSVAAWQTELQRLCAPLDITDALTLDTAVATSFREGFNRPFDRWASKLRHALNLSLWPRVTRNEAKEVETALRIYNPSQPERTIQGGSDPFTDQLITAVQSGNFSTVLVSNETMLLNYHDVAVKPNGDGAIRIEVLCLLQEISAQRGSFNPQLDQSFRSSELPVVAKVRTLSETCCRLDVEMVLFGPFTPAIPLPTFQTLVGVKDKDFLQKNWRYGRRNEARGFGQPERGGCSLSIPRSAVKVPSGFKLVWIVWMNDAVVTVVDEHNNKLYGL